MMITLLLLMFFFCFTVIKQLNNYYSVVYSLTLFSIMIILLLTSFYINITSINVYFFQVERYIFMLFNKLSGNRFSIFNIRTFLYFAISVYLFAMYMAAVQNRIFKKHLPITAAVMCGLLALLFFNSNFFTEALYLKYKLTDDLGQRELCINICRYTHMANIAVFSILSALPHIQAMRKYSALKMIHKKKQALLFTVILVVFQAFIMYLICFSPIRGYFINRSITALFEHSVIIQSDTYYFSFFILIAAIACLSVIAIFRLKIFEEINFFKTRRMKKNSRYVFDDIRPVFHSIKNSLILLNNYNTQLLKNIDNPDALHGLIERSQGNINELFSNVTAFLDSYKKQTLRFTDIEFNSFVNNIADSLIIPDNIKLIKQLCERDIAVFGDRHALHDAIYNVIQNSAEAIGKKSGVIIISIWAEDEYVCLSIRDSGSGISKKQLKKIFNPLFSTKQSHSNWGLGLAYTYKVIKAHLGIIEVKSKPGIGTEFQIAIPEEGGIQQ